MKFTTKIQEKQRLFKNAPPVTIVCIGDSVTQGCFELHKSGPTTLRVVFDYQNSYCTKLREMLNLLYPSTQINVINSGISGDDAVGGLERLERDVLKFSPDLVIVGFALNDSTKGLEKLDEYSSSMTKIVRKIKDFGAECILLTPNMMNTKISSYVQNDTLMSIAENCMKTQNEGILDKYVETLKEVAATENIKICDVYAKWKKMSRAGVDVTALLSNYVNHPLRELHSLIASTLIDTILDD